MGQKVRCVKCGNTSVRPVRDVALIDQTHALPCGGALVVTSGVHSARGKRAGYRFRAVAVRVAAAATRAVTS